jgi:hypothetical protein
MRRRGAQATHSGGGHVAFFPLAGEPIIQKKSMTSVIFGVF